MLHDPGVLVGCVGWEAKAKVGRGCGLKLSEA